MIKKKRSSVWHIQDGCCSEVVVHVIVVLAMPYLKAGCYQTSLTVPGSSLPEVHVVEHMGCEQLARRGRAWHHEATTRPAFCNSSLEATTCPTANRHPRQCPWSRCLDEDWTKVQPFLGHLNLTSSFRSRVRHSQDSF